MLVTPGVFDFLDGVEARADTDDEGDLYMAGEVLYRSWVRDRLPLKQRPREQIGHHEVVADPLFVHDRPKPARSTIFIPIMSWIVLRGRRFLSYVIFSPS